MNGENTGRLLAVIDNETVGLSFCGQPSLLYILRENGVAINAPCAGRGCCGRCLVWAAGELSEPDEKELEVLLEVAAPVRTNTQSNIFMYYSPKDFTLRLACRTKALGDAAVILPREHSAIKLTGSPVARLKGGGKSLRLAIDLGTTTIGLRAYDADSTRLLAQICEPNAQRACGADVMTRISFCETDGGFAKLRSLLHRQLCEMTSRAVREAGGAAVVSAALAGNTVMQHIAAGFSPLYLGQSPYRTKESFGGMFGAEAVGLPVDTYLAPCTGGFTGGDLTCALLALEKERRSEKPYLLCDLGTNGELALCAGDGILVTSAAAGPALEGGGISCGSAACEGAATRIISPPECCGGRLIIETIDGMRDASSLTGAALLDLTALLLDRDVIDSSGYMPSGEWRINERIGLNQRDVRQIQLAKGAIAAAMLRLCQSSGLDPRRDGLEIIITGGLGNSISPASALRTGLIPPELSRCEVSLAPNLALEGAALCLSESERGRAAQIAGRCSVVDLTGDALFDELFIGNMAFPERSQG